MSSHVGSRHSDATVTTYCHGCCRKWAKCLVAPSTWQVLQGRKDPSSFTYAALGSPCLSSVVLMVLSRGCCGRFRDRVHGRHDAAAMVVVLARALLRVLTELF
eukprot:9919536-Alexandrium_andersonii.AAC.1